MSRASRSLAAGAFAFVFAWVAAWALLLAFAFAADRLGTRGNDAMRQVAASALLASVVAANLAVAGLAPFALADRMRANPWIALATAGTLSGLTAYWLLLFVSITNDCTVGVALPYPLVHAC